MSAEAVFELEISAGDETDNDALRADLGTDAGKDALLDMYMRDYACLTVETATSAYARHGRGALGLWITQEHVPSNVAFAVRAIYWDVEDLGHDLFPITQGTALERDVTTYDPLKQCVLFFSWPDGAFAVVKMNLDQHECPNCGKTDQQSQPAIFGVVDDKTGERYTAVGFGADEVPAEFVPVPRAGCYFCRSGESPAWRYPATDVALPMLFTARDGGEFESDEQANVVHGDWLACASCAELIEAGDWPALARRGARTLGLDFSNKPPGTRVRWTAVFRGIHSTFQRARRPEPRRPIRFETEVSDA